MADTTLLPPDPTKPTTATFEPTPVPSTPQTPAPAAASPSASGLAAPGAQPSSPAAAPGDNGLATPNPTVAGNNMATQGKEALNSLAQPAPLPPTPAQEAAASAAKTAASNKASDAARQVATGQQKPAPAAQAKPAAKTAAQETLDILAPIKDNIKKMIDGNDPIAKIQFNNILTANGPRDQAMLQNMGLKLKQSNLDGQGAGSALLAMLARDNEYNEDQLRANVSADSAKRLYDMNLHGFDKAIEIQQEEARTLRSDLASALQNGQLGAAKGLFEKVYPGVPFDESAARAASPTANAAYTSRMKLVDQFVSQGDAASAKTIMDKLAEDMPEMFGFPNDPAAAKASVAGIDFSTEAWQNNQKNISDASSAARTAALQGDPSALSSSIDQLFAKMTPAAVESIATSAAKSRSLDEINKILTASGMAPVESTDEAALLDKNKFAKAVKTYDLMQDSKKDVVDGLLDTFAKADPAIAIDPAARTAARAWLAMHAYGIATNPNSGAVTNFTLDDKATPPWDPSSPQAYMFMDWPMATFDMNTGSVISHDYDGLTPYSESYKPGDATTAKGREDKRLDSQYEQYTFSTPVDQRLPMKEWYYATMGGMASVNEKLLTGSLSKPVSTTDKTTIDPLVAAASVNDKIAKGEALTADDITTAKTQKLIPAMTAAGGGANTILGGGAATYLQSHPDGNLLMDGQLVHLNRGYTAGSMSLAEIEYKGEKYYLDNKGRWYATPVVANSRSMPPTIENPLK